MKKITELEILGKEQQHFMDLVTNLEQLRITFYSTYPIERIEKDKKIPYETDLLKIQFDALKDTVWRMIGECHNKRSQIILTTP